MSVNAFKRDDPVAARLLRIVPYNEVELYTELSALLAAAPAELRTVNLSDRFTFASGVSQALDDGLADFDDLTEVYGDEGADFDGEFEG